MAKLVTAVSITGIREGNDGPSREEDCLEDMALAEQQGADMVEIRRDYFDRLSLQKVRAKTKKPLIFTYRDIAEAGSDPRAGFKGTEEKRAEVYEIAAHLGFEYADIEHRHFVLPSFRANGMKIIRSWHDFNGTPSLEELFRIYKEIAETEPYAVKIATMAVTDEDSQNMLRLYDQAAEYNKERHSEIKLVAMCMGEKGLRTRVLGPEAGAPWVYVARSQGQAASPGQPTREYIIQRRLELGLAA